MSAATTLTTHRAVGIRPMRADDIEAAAQIVLDAFAGIADRHGFPRDFPTIGSARGLVTAFSGHPSIWSVVAEHDGRLVGSNFLDERGSVRGVGPISVDPGAQATGVGRVLMQAVLERASGSTSVRLLQDSFNTASLALYSSLGFDAVEQTVLVTGVPVDPPAANADPAVTVRSLTPDDLDHCEALCIAVHGFERTAELLDALASPDLTPVVAHRGGRLVAYATTFADFGLAHAVAASEDDLFELLVGAVCPDGPTASFLLPLHQHSLVRRCLSAGLRFVKPMTYMVAGQYRRPQGGWIPSVLY